MNDNKNNNSIAETAQQIVHEFGQFEEWMDKYEYLIDLGRELPLIDDEHKDEQHLISGCQSQVWLHAKYRDGKVLYTADSDAMITKGLASLLIRALSGHTPKEITEADLSFIDTIGLKEHLSPTRSNGLLSMIKQMKLYAVVFQTKEKGAAS